MRVLVEVGLRLTPITAAPCPAQMTNPTSSLVQRPIPVACDAVVYVGGLGTDAGEVELLGSFAVLPNHYRPAKARRGV